MSAAADTGPLRVVQITDCHLGAAPGTRLLNIDTDASLAAVLEQVRRERGNADLLLATGDLSDSGSDAAYRRLHTATADFGCARWLPGNHDSPATMRCALTGASCLERVFALADWQVIMLDSSVPGAVHGHLAAAELAALRACLQDARHNLICIHHPVLAVGCAWLDAQMVANAAEFWALVAETPSVRGVLCGHVHQETDCIHAGVRVLTTPSTAWQFAPASADFRVDDLAPGYRWLELHADGRIDTGVERVETGRFLSDTDCEGY